MNSAFIETRQRWDAFLSNILERFHETLQQAEAILPQLLDYQNFDTLPFGNAWTGIRGQVQELIGKIGDTWDEKVSPAFELIKEAGEAEIEAAGNGLDDFYLTFYEHYYKELDKGRDLMHQLDKELKAYEVRTFAHAGRKLQAKAREILSGHFACTQCKAPLPVKHNFFRSYYQACEYCQTVNTFEPGTVARNVENFALHPLAEEQALTEYFAYWDLENKYRSQRQDQPKTITSDEVLRAYTQYAEKYLKACIAIIPDLEVQYEKDLEAKVAHVKKWILTA
ncbi:MAG TPA: hypothetical protein VD794_11775 [Flavisolibacter sp.]|nr:hypothetical protein [Flavisolibacter sp.]